MDITIKSPQECSGNELELFIRLVRDGGQVERKGLPGRVNQAKTLAFLAEDGEAVGIAALKQPIEGYRDNIFAKANATVSPKSFLYEVGWVVVVEQHRGRKLSHPLVEAVMSKAEGRDIFATSAITRVAMHRTLQHFGFVQHGQQYPPSQGHEGLLLFIRTTVQPSCAAGPQKPRPAS